MAMLVAVRTGAEIVSVDSMQVYRGMDVGTAKPSVDDRQRVHHHMIDVADPSEAYSVARFQEAGRAVIREVRDRGRRVLVVGGSGLHFRALVDPLVFAPSDPSVRARLEAMSPAEAVATLLHLDPAAGRHVDLANPRRVIRALEVHALTGGTPTRRSATPQAAAVRAYLPIEPVAAVGVDPGQRLGQRVADRLERMLAGGLLEEVRALLPRLGTTARAAVGYREFARVVSGEWDQGYAARRAAEATMAMARRQRTYHRRDPRITWLEWDDDAVTAADAAQRTLEEAGWTS